MGGPKRTSRSRRTAATRAHSGDSVELSGTGKALSRRGFTSAHRESKLHEVQREVSQDTYVTGDKLERALSSLFEELGELGQI